MSYTQEQLKGMSDFQVEMILAKSLGLRNVHERGGMVCYQMQFGGSKAVQYCTDWSATGTLMVEYGVSLSFSSTGSPHAYSSRGNRYDSYNPNPLRAVCEVILMMESE